MSIVDFDHFKWPFLRRRSNQNPNLIDFSSIFLSEIQKNVPQKRRFEMAKKSIWLFDLCVKTKTIFRIVSSHSTNFPIEFIYMQISFPIALGRLYLYHKKTKLLFGRCLPSKKHFITNCTLLCFVSQNTKSSNGR